MVARVTMLFLTLTALFACDCGTPSIDEAYRRADAVFVGINRTDPTIEEAWTARRYTFEVKEVLKGKIGKTVVMDTAYGTDCALVFPLNWTSLIYASKNQRTGTLGTSLCSRTKSMENAEQEVRQLRRIRDAGNRKAAAHEPATHKE